MDVNDRFALWVEFSPLAKSILAQGKEPIFLQEVSSFYGLPKETILNQGPKNCVFSFFVAKKVLDIKQFYYLPSTPNLVGKPRGLIKFLRNTI